MTAPHSIPFIDLAAQQVRIRSAIDQAIGKVLDHGGYIMGPEVRSFEQALGTFCGAKHALGCANGTDALMLALMALGVGPGDAVFVPSFTFAATAEVVPLVGATPVFVDSDERTFNIDPASLERSIVEARLLGLRTRAVIPVDLFGLPADLLRIEALAHREGIDVICDSAQGFGGSIDGRMTGTFGRITTTSFFPAKPLGCYGDGGAVFTEDDEIARILESLRVHGKGADKYDNVRVGLNSRLDTLQAAILSVKLDVYEGEIDARNAIATRYSERLSNIADVPHVPAGYRSIWAQYTIKLNSKAERDVVQKLLDTAGVPTQVYYAAPLHQQTLYAAYPKDPAGLAVAERHASRVLSLPMHPYLLAETQEWIIDQVYDAIECARA